MLFPPNNIFHFFYFFLKCVLIKINSTLLFPIDTNLFKIDSFPDRCFITLYIDKLLLISLVDGQSLNILDAET